MAQILGIERERGPSLYGLEALAPLVVVREFVPDIAAVDDDRQPHVRRVVLGRLRPLDRDQVVARKGAQRLEPCEGRLGGLQAEGLDDVVLELLLEVRDGMLFAIGAEEGARLVRRRCKTAVFEETARVHAALGQDAEHRLPFPFQGRPLQSFDAVVAEDAPAEHSVFALEESKRVAGGPVEGAVGVCGLRRVEALAREASLRGPNQQRRRGYLLVLLERGLVSGAQARRIELRRRVDALLGHVLLDASLERQKLRRVARRVAVDEVRQEPIALS